MAGISCPSCGGKMTFSISKQVLVCSSCGNEISVEDYQQNNEAESHKDTYNALVCVCKNCGAELLSPDEQTVAYCSYCGSEQMLTAKYEDVIRPKTILPFTKTKKQAKAEYEKALKGKLYVPKAFKNPEFLEGFRGVYLPYYSYEAVVPEKSLDLQGNKNYRKGSYDYSEEYNVHADLGGISKSVKYDASIAFDDTIANEIAPFDTKDEKKFRDAYLAGFYADKATTEISTYIEDATESAIDAVYEEISANCGNVRLADKKTLDEKKAEIGIGSFNCDVTLYPIWFLTWRNKNRVAYSVMNGQTGKMSTDIPVNKKIFLLVSFIAAAVIFVILSLLPVFILPKTMGIIAAILALISGIVLNREIRRIYFRESHVYDYGDTLHKAKKKKRIKPDYSIKGNTKPKRSFSGWGCLSVIVVYIAFYVVAGAGAIISAIASSVSASVGFTAVLAITFILQAIFSVFTMRYAAGLEKKSALIPALFTPLALFFGLVVGVFNPAHDYWYYGVTLANLIALVLNGLSAINYFNYLTTRPVPNFFTREGADNGQ